MSNASDEQILPLANHDSMDWPATTPSEPPRFHGEGRLAKITGWLRQNVPLLPSAMIGVLIVIAGVLILWATIKAVVQDVVIVEAISVPKELEAKGLSGAVISQRIQDEIDRMVQASKSAKKETSLAGERHREQLSSVQLPTTGLSVQTLVVILRDLFGRDDIRIGGEIVGDKSGSAGAAPTRTSLLIRTERKNVRHVARFEGYDLDRQIESAAIEVLKRIDPSRLAAYFFHMKAWDEMDQMIDHMLATADDSDRKWALNLRGNHLYQQFKRDEAMEYYERAIALDGKFAVALMNKGLVLAERGDHAGAVEMYKTAAAADPKSHLTFNNWGILLLQRGEYDDAIAKLKDAIAARPKEVIARTNLGYLWTTLDDHEKAAAEYELAFEIDTTNMHRLATLGTALYRLKDRARAEARFLAALKRSPLHDVYNAWGDALFSVGDIEGARERYQRALQSDPANGYASVRIGRTWMDRKTSDADLALAWCLQAVELAPALAKSHVYCGDYYRVQEEYDAALWHYRRAVALEPQNAGHWSLLAWTCYANDEPARGNDAYLRATQISPHLASIYLDWGQSLFNAGEFKRAIAMYDQAIDRKPKYQEAYSRRARALREDGRNEEADASDRTARAIAEENALLALSRTPSRLSLVELRHPNLHFLISP